MAVPLSPKTTDVQQWDWDHLTEALVNTKRKMRGSASEANALREFFGEEELRELQQIAELGQRRRAAGTLGNVVLLHGIMGSNLIVKKKKDEDLIWLNVRRIAAGRMEDLRRDQAGKKEANEGVTVLKGDLLKLFYAKTVLRLRSRWNVKPFAYDWRMDINLSSKELETFIEKEFPDQPVHLVAHSMGGLVCRNLIRQNQALWNRLYDAKRPASGGRLIMLGTPNYGAFTWVQVLTGEESMVKWMAALDFWHNTAEISQIVGTFPGGYQMLPAPSKLSPIMMGLYRYDSWGQVPAIESQLQTGYDFQQQLDTANVIDPSRMRYIAGYNQSTICGIKVVGPGDFDYLTTLEGDGRVPHKLGLLQGVPAYYVDEAHGDLPKNNHVLDAVDELLETGSTTALPAKPARARAVPAEELRYQHLTEDRDVLRQLQSTAARHKQGEASPEEIRIAQRTLLEAAMGAKRTPPPKQAEATGIEKDITDVRHVLLTIQTKPIDVTKVEAPVVVVGHYRGIPPIRAVGAIDHAMKGWITKAGENGMIAGELGETYFIPVPEWSAIRADTVMLAGMGEVGRFTASGLQLMMTNVTLAVLNLEHDHMASVLIGSGEGNLDTHSALLSMLTGITEAIRQTHRTDTPHHKPTHFTLVLVDKYESKLADIHRHLQEIQKEGSIAHATITLSLTKLKKRGERATDQTRPPSAAQESDFATRLTIERDRVNEELFRFSALSNSAVIPVREKTLQKYIVEQTALRLKNSTDRQGQEKHGKLLYTYLVPEDFHTMIRDARELSLILDRSTASIPWEMACFKGNSGTEWWGTNLQLNRQFKTLLSSTPSPSTKPNRKLRVLIIADPAKDEDYQLPGARQEGRQVAQVIRTAAAEINKSDHLKTVRGGSICQPVEIDVVECVGSEQCDIVEILALLLTEEFDIVHYAGHGAFDQQNPSKSGWVFGENLFLTANEIFQARRLPRLVFANACFSGEVREGQALSSMESSRQLAGMAEAFFERGVQNFIGAGWPVGDEQAVTFAKTFYQKLLKEQQSIGDSLAAARASILYDGSTWGAYQYYGRGATKLLFLNR